MSFADIYWNNRNFHEAHLLKGVFKAISHVQPSGRPSILLENAPNPGRTRSIWQAAPQWLCCHPGELYQPDVNAIFQEPQEDIEENGLAHWCKAWQYSFSESYEKSFLPFPGQYRYISGQLPIAVSLLHATRSSSKATDKAFAHDIEHIVTRNPSIQAIISQFGLDFPHVCQVWDYMRPLVLPSPDLFSFLNKNKEDTPAKPWLLREHVSAWQLYSYYYTDKTRVEEGLSVRKFADFEQLSLPPKKRV